jgi:hypothetical protein
MVYIAPNQPGSKVALGGAHQGPVLRERGAGHGLVVSVTSFEDFDAVIAIANDTHPKPMGFV